MHPPHLFPLEEDVAHVEDGGEYPEDGVLLPSRQSQHLHGRLQVEEVGPVILRRNLTAASLYRNGWRY